MWTKSLYRRFSILVLCTALVFLMIPEGYAGKTLSEDAIKNALFAQGYRDVYVEVRDGNHVRIEGEVDLLSDRYRIFNIAARFPGVKYVTNAVVVDAPLVPDDMIEAEVRNMFHLIYGIKDPDAIEIEVDGGVVQLLGTVDMHRTKALARNAAAWVKGVKGVVNDIAVKPVEKATTDENIRNMIGDILENWYTLEPGDNVQYTVNDGKVTLSGRVSGFWTKSNFAEDVSNLIGVKDVEDHLTVED